MYEITLLLESKDVPASNGATFDRLNPSRAMSQAAPRQPRSPTPSARPTPPQPPSRHGPPPARMPRRAILLKAADLLASKAPQFIELMAAETGATAGWAGFNVHLAAGMLREAAADDHADFRRGHPLGQAGLHRDGGAPARRRGAEHGAVERAGHPRRARHRAAAGLRQHRGAEGLRNLPGHASADRRMPARRRPAAGRAQRHHQRAGRRAGPDRGADRPSRRAPGQLHRLDAGRPHHRAGRGEISQAGAARTRRQGADDRARRRRYRRRGGRRGVRRLHEPGPDLHVDRAHRRRREGRRRLRRPSSRRRPDRWSPAIPARAIRRSDR